MKQLLCAICAFFIYISHANAISVDYSVNGDKSYYDFNGDKDGILYLIKPGSWGVRFQYGDVYGIASCNNTPGVYAETTAPSGNMTSTANGEKCWCRLIQIKGENITNAPWVFSYDYDNADDCANRCANGCALGVAAFPGFRGAVFRSAGVSDSGNAQPDPPAPQQQACDSDNDCTGNTMPAIESERNASAERIRASVARVKNTLGSMKLSAWKTTDGKFNTARLASDSIAGIVLGTAGGLITSSLVKKSQIKKGFEDIQCAIGGQSVASYGDEFTVGVH